MPNTAQEVFDKSVGALAPTKRLRLAALILDDLAQSNLSLVDIGSLWSEKDQEDLTAFSLQYAARLYPEDEELV